MAWFIVDFHRNDASVVGIASACVGVNMLYQLGNISLLSLYGGGILVDFTLFEIVGECTGVDIFFRIAVAEIGLGGQYYRNSPVLKTAQKIVEQVKMFVVNQVAGAVGQFGVPQMQSESVGSHAAEMIHVAVYSFLVVYVEHIHGSVGMRERKRVVCSVISDLFIGVRTAHASMFVNIDRIVVFGFGFKCSQVGCQCQ